MIEKARPEAIVSAGFSGALQPGLELGTIVVGENFSDPQIVRAIPPHCDFRAGPTITVPEILETVAAKKTLGESSRALAVDLESEHLYRVCLDAGIPMLSVRAISDTLEQEIPLPGSVLLDPATGRPDPVAIFHHLFKHPSQAPQFAKLVGNARVARQKLATALGIIVPALLKSNSGNR